MICGKTNMQNENVLLNVAVVPAQALSSFSMKKQARDEW
jgi:hypothetical protein